MPEHVITVLDDGPLVVRAGARVLDSQGIAYETAAVIALCRCGASSTKPFCDGSHRTNGFRSAPRGDAPQPGLPHGQQPATA